MENIYVKQILDDITNINSLLRLGQAVCLFYSFIITYYLFSE